MLRSPRACCACRRRRRHRRDRPRQDCLDRCCQFLIGAAIVAGLAGASEILVVANIQVTGRILDCGRARAGVVLEQGAVVLVWIEIVVVDR